MFQVGLVNYLDWFVWEIYVVGQLLQYYLVFVDLQDGEVVFDVEDGFFGCVVQVVVEQVLGVGQVIVGEYLGWVVVVYYDVFDEFDVVEVEYGRFCCDGINGFVVLL